jgi:cell division protein FtsW
MAKIAIASVGVLGKGPGNSTQRNLLPHPYSDFIYAIIIEEWGLIGGLFVLMLYVFFFTRCVMLAKACKTTFSAMMVTGLAILITSQALLHICVNVGLLPVTGHTLPLISLGGTSLIIMSGAFGVILSVSRTIEKVKESEDVIVTEL